MSLCREAFRLLGKFSLSPCRLAFVVVLMWLSCLSSTDFCRAAEIRVDRSTYFADDEVSWTAQLEGIAFPAILDWFVAFDRTVLQRGQQRLRFKEDLGVRLLLRLPKELRDRRTRLQVCLRVTPGELVRQGDQESEAFKSEFALLLLPRSTSNFAQRWPEEGRVLIPTTSQALKQRLLEVGIPEAAVNSTTKLTFESARTSLSESDPKQVVIVDCSSRPAPDAELIENAMQAGQSMLVLLPETGRLKFRLPDSIRFAAGSLAVDFGKQISTNLTGQEPSDRRLLLLDSEADLCSFSFGCNGKMLEFDLDRSSRTRWLVLTQSLRADSADGPAPLEKLEGANTLSRCIFLALPTDTPWDSDPALRDLLQNALCWLASPNLSAQPDGFTDE